ncbi:Hypothetical protein A7982_04544 [Minicystis rosea]|nr:Hypothetical protein A7982_04544 [Minicystis rosea]
MLKRYIALRTVSSNAALIHGPELASRWGFAYLQSHSSGVSIGA